MPGLTAWLFMRVLRRKRPPSKRTCARFVKGIGNLTATDRQGFTALMLASAYNYKDVVEDLLRAGADPDASDKNGDTALMLAAFYGCDETVDVLLRSGAHIDAVNHDGETALMAAIAGGCERTVKYLMEHGADINATER